MTFNPAPDKTSWSETATLDTNTPLEQQQEYESSSLTVLVHKGTCTPNDARIPCEISESKSTVDLPETLYENKEYSRSKTDKRRNSRKNERKNLLERRESQNKRSSGGKRYSLIASLAQVRMDLKKQEQSFQNQPLNSEIPH